MIIKILRSTVIQGKDVSAGITIEVSERIGRMLIGMKKAEKYVKREECQEVVERQGKKGSK